MTSKLIRESLWKLIRAHYTEDEKKSLRKALNGTCICPSGSFIDLDLLSTDLRRKIEADLKEKIDVK